MAPSSTSASIETKIHKNNDLYKAVPVSQSVTAL